MRLELPVRSDLPASRWKALHSQRLDWAHRALHAFNDTLDKGISDTMIQEGPGEAHVVVYGKTQVGKTSLILDLMGVLPDQQARVSRVLRGGREEGKSATAVATAYRRSNDSSWHLQYGHGGLVAYRNDAGMTRALGKIREQMATRALRASDRCTIFIPSECFRIDAVDGPGMRMLDLPGAQARDAVEKKYVKEVARLYLPSADLILLVGKADDLGFLKADALDIPGIEDWQLIPERFRVVTTFSFTPESVIRLMVQNRGQLNATLFRKRFFGQLERSGIPLDPRAAVPERFYPLEFGGSWRGGLDGVHAALLREVAPVLEKLKADLQADIAASAGDYIRFENACRVHVVATRLKERRLAQFVERIEEAVQERVSARKRLEVLQEGVEQIAATRRATMRKIAGLQDKSMRDAVREFSEIDETALVASIVSRDRRFEKASGIHDLVSIAAGSESVPEFQALLEKFQSALRTDVQSRRPVKGWPVEKLLPLGKSEQHFGMLAKDIEAIVRDNLAQIRNVLGCHLINGYFPSISSSLSDDRRLMESSMRRAVDAVSSRIERFWLERLGAALEEQEMIKGALDAKQASAKLRFQRAVDEEAEIAQRIGSLRAERTKCKSGLDKALRSKEIFLELLDHHYLAELRQRRIAVASALSPSSQMVELLACAQMIEERTGLMKRLA